MLPFLIADDSPGKMLMLQAFLKKAQWEGEVLTAETAEEAEEIVEEHPEIGFAFIDYYIPSKNGPWIIRMLKTKNPTARIALVTSSERKDNQEEAIAAGAEKCICTSYEAEIVEREVMNVLSEWVGK